MELKDNFAHWFKTAAGVGKTPAEKYEERIKAIETLTAEIEVKDALDLLRLYCNLTPKDSNALSIFSKHFQEHDPSFDTRDTPFVFQVLSAISLIHLLSGESNYAADAVGLALLSYTFNGHKKILPKESVSADLEVAAHNYLSRESSQLRNVGNFKLVRTSNTDSGKSNKLDLKELKAPADQAGDLAVKTAHTLFSSVNAAIVSAENNQAALVDSINEELKEIHRALQVNSEETNIFWWLASEWSRDFPTPYVELDSSQACLLAGKELADLTVFIPGHNSAIGFLSRIIKLTKEQSNQKTNQKEQNATSNLTIKDAINGIPEEWYKAWVGMDTVQAVIDFCPLHFALSKRLELGNEGWVKLFERQLGIKTSASFRPYEVSHQFYQERLLARASA
jgi:hypothetical protein